MQPIHFDIVDSTNEEAKRQLRAGKVHEPCYILAREQTAGRGSRGRSWCSPRDAGIYLSVVDICPGALQFDVTDLTRAAGVAGADALRCAGISVTVKAPNDLMVADAKLGGILVETVAAAGKKWAIVTGIGVNIADCPRELGRDQSSVAAIESLLSAESFRQLDVEHLVANLVVEIRRRNREVLSGEADVVQSAWNAMLAS